MANPNIGELFKDRRVVIGTAVVALGAAAGVAFLLFGQGSGEPEVADTPPPATTAAAPNPSAPGNPGRPTPPRPTQNATAAAPVGPPKVATSFDGAPPGFPFVGAPAGGGLTPPPGQTPPIGAGGVTDTATAKLALAPIKPNVKAPKFRGDPFVSYRNPAVARTAAYEFIVPIRVASRAQPKVKPPTGNPEVDFGPLPYVPRRVAGVLYNGEVSAILETGTPGQDSTVEIIQPGTSVSSGIPGFPNLSVAVISPTQVILRADDGRTVSVPLTLAPAGSFPTGGGAGGVVGGGGDPRGGGRTIGGGRGGRGAAAGGPDVGI